MKILKITIPDSFLATYLFDSKILTKFPKNFLKI